MLAPSDPLRFELLHKFKTLAEQPLGAAPPWRQAGPPRAQVRVLERLLRTLVDLSGTGCSLNCAGCMSHNTVARTACSGAAGGRAQGDTQDERGGAGSVLRRCADHDDQHQRPPQQRVLQAGK